MSRLDRRSFLLDVLAAGAAVAGTALPARASSSMEPAPGRKGVLVDTTVCIGCRSCEQACKAAHGLPTAGPEVYEDDGVFKTTRRPDASALTVVNRRDGERPSFVKAQCMNCDHPACASACIVGAFTKEESGAVTWDSGKCIGCRYCMVACPFQIPAFEWGKALEPRIMKCDFCAPRQREGKLPACVERCPAGALTFGPRDELVQAAHERIKRFPERYVPRVYGELEVGGTSWMYLAARELAGDGLPKLGTHPAPGVSESIQHGIFAYFVPPVALYSLLGFLMWDSKNGPREGGQ